ncbi:hypothetical protein QLH51_16735 [Sphingomonas sp. 2R-10]|uniref:DUF4139 domain-containing protein n=1 Tax=Sphingomonas sp. 2R-10 TaxID=3045148 RepID=UPI000F772ECB|nr:hypothetical protein [Sphingomonas sp. 2R-10]MDJ0278445.1 hypothetical protein [Sphingomonas sp. 2R-10]
MATATPLAARDLASAPTRTPAEAGVQLGDDGDPAAPRSNWTPASAGVRSARGEDSAPATTPGENRHIAAIPYRDPPTVTSPAPQTVAVTLYRAPHRGTRERMDLRNLQGYALVTETRRITLPRGRAVVRFEGVAGGIIPVSAVIDGLPGGTVEKNRDARLLSPVALVDGTLGNRVTLRRTDRGSGVVREEPATIVSGPAGGVVVQTASGVEALDCAGLADSLKYARIPAGLSARPVLSVTTDSLARRTATVRLSYLATGFDWSASYVGTLRGDRLDLFAWTTLANGNGEGFADAEVQVVAGRLNRERVDAVNAAATRLQLRCYPLGTTTSDLRQESFEAADEIVVTAARMAIPPPPPPPMEAPPPPPAPAAPENLGDVKLYRLPGRTTVAAKGQKQVALLRQDGVAYSRIYRRRVGPGQVIPGGATDIVLRVKNEKADGLGIALPAGTTALYAPRGQASLLIGTGTMTDRAEGETVLIGAGSSRQVMVTQRQTAPNAARLTLTNASGAAAAIEIPIGYPGGKVEAPGLERIDGIQTWRVTLPPGDTATLDYRY